MRFRIVLALAAATALTACNQAASTPEPKTDEEKAMYGLGVLLSQNIRSFDFTDEELAMVKAGFVAGAKDTATMKMEEIQAMIPKLQEMEGKRAEAAVTREKEAGTAYVAKAEKEAGVTKLPSGMLYTQVQEGTGEQPKATDVVKVHYTGTFVDGKQFDSSVERGEPATFPLDGVIPCWGEGVQQMKVGGKAKLVCPPDLAYGDQGRPPQMRGGATLLFDVELLGIEAAQGAADPAAAGAAQ